MDALDLQAEAVKLRAEKEEVTNLGREYRDKNGKAKAHEMKLLGLMEFTKFKRFDTEGTLFTHAHRVKGNITDRKRFVRWALEQDEGVQEFLQESLKYLDNGNFDQEAWINDFYEAVMNTALVEYKPEQAQLNKIATAHTDDGIALPPGMDFYPDDYVSMTGTG